MSIDIISYNPAETYRNFPDVPGKFLYIFSTFSTNFLFILICLYQSAWCKPSICLLSLKFSYFISAFSPFSATQERVYVRLTVSQMTATTTTASIPVLKNRLASMVITRRTGISFPIIAYAL